MKVRVVFFASLREAVGTEQLTLELAAGNFGALRAQLMEALGEAADALWADNVRLAHNQELHAEAVDTLVLADGDELAFLPPVTGG